MIWLPFSRHARVVSCVLAGAVICGCRQNEARRDDAPTAMRPVATLSTNVWHVQCSQHPGGGWCQEYSSLEAADKALEDHKTSTGHTDVARSAGKCPF
jgi:hypothetical protein